jgi:hypothetical protein
MAYEIEVNPQTTLGGRSRGTLAAPLRAPDSVWYGHVTNAACTAVTVDHLLDAPPHQLTRAPIRQPALWLPRGL